MQKLQPQRQCRHHDVLVQGMRTIPLGTQAVQRRHAECGGEVAVAAATGQRHFAEFETGCPRYTLCALEQCLHVL